MKKHRQILALILILILILQTAGCKNNHNDTQPPESESQTKDDNLLVYGRSENIVLDTAIDFQALNVEYFDDAVELYQDTELNNKVYCKYKWDKEHHTLSLLPPNRPVLNISTNFSSKSLQKNYDHSDYYFFDKGENKDWGNLGTMYLAKWIDLKTGEKLTQPEITKIQISGELDTPKNFQFLVSEQGNATLSWNAVENAEMYLIVQAVYRTDELCGFFESCHIYAETADTNWQPEIKGRQMNNVFAQSDLKIYEGSENYYGVIAISKNGTSMISSVISETEMAKRLPYCMLENGNKGENFPERYAESIELLSRYQWIELCDHTMAQRLINYQTDKAGITSVTLVGKEPADMLRIPYTIEGTEFEGSCYVKKFDADTYPKELKLLQQRQNILKSKMAGMLSDVKITVKPDGTKKDASENKNDTQLSPEDASGNDLMVPTATTELSQYLASCLLQGEENVLLSGLSEPPNENTFMDAFYEAYFQNPLIPAIKEISVSESLNEMSVIYEEDKETAKKKQKEAAEQINFIAKELLEEKMTDTDKVLAINSYLCNNIKYDSQTAEASLTGTDAYSDSASVYGALVNHKGICTAYAGTFQLLAKAMGLESIVVTGTLNGNQNHTWNKVKIDGKWYVVDVTGNDGSEIQNVLLNVSDDTAALRLKEDNRYLCDENIKSYVADSDAKEYYRLSGQYFKKDKIAKALIKELTYDNKAMLRTDESLNNEEFQAIVKQVMDGLDQTEIQGYFELGVIYLER